MFHEAMTPENLALLPLLIVTAFGAILPILGAFRVRPGALAVLALIGVVLAGATTLATVWDVPGLGFMPQVSSGGPPLLSYGLLEMTPFVVLFDLVFLAVAFVVILASPRYMTRRHQGEYYGLLLLSTVGAMTVAASRDLITLFVGIELASFCTYALAGYFKRRLDSSEAAMKYFLIGSVSSALALFGISIVYGLTGTTSFTALQFFWGTPPAADANAPMDLMRAGAFPMGVFVWGLLLAGFGYKIAVVPFHNYALDVYEGAPTTVSGFLAAGSKQMGFAALFKVFLLGLLAVKFNWQVAVGVLSVVTMIVGNVGALVQTNIKRMLAYSSVAQAGYILMALSIGTEQALTGGLFHIVTYSIMTAGAFAVLAAAATWGVGERMEEWKGMAARAPFASFAMAVFLFSLAGIPPLAGFASKFVLFSSAVAAGGAYLWLAVFGVLTSAISLVYYWYVVRVMYIEEGEGRRLAVAPGAAVAIFVALLATFAFGILPAMPLDLSADAARTIFAQIPRAILAGA